MRRAWLDPVRAPTTMAARYTRLYSHTISCPAARARVSSYPKDLSRKGACSSTSEKHTGKAPEFVYIERRIEMAVARVSEVVASSPKGWVDAAMEGFKRASKTLHNITGFEVIKHTAHVEGGKVTEFRVTMRIIFVLDE
jgi:flavin-binding protein dodecin